MPLTQEQIDDRITYHPPNEERIKHHTEVRGAIGNTMAVFNEIGSDSREKSVALTKLEEVMFWMNAHIARNIR